MSFWEKYDKIFDLVSKGKIGDVEEHLDRYPEVERAINDYTKNNVPVAVIAAQNNDIPMLKFLGTIGANLKHYKIKEWSIKHNNTEMRELSTFWIYKIFKNQKFELYCLTLEDALKRVQLLIKREDCKPENWIIDMDHFHWKLKNGYTAFDIVKMDSRE